MKRGLVILKKLSRLKVSVWLMKLVALIIIAALLSGCLLKTEDTVIFQGTSMLPGIKDGERIRIERFDRGAKFNVKRGDIVMFLYPEDTSKFYIKRLIGLPKETVEIREGKVFIDGTELSEPYVDPKRNMMNFPREPVYVKEHYYYVLGDNRDSSSDSRSWGLVPEKNILGKAIDK